MRRIFNIFFRSTAKKSVHHIFYKNTQHRPIQFPPDELKILIVGQQRQHLLRIAQANIPVILFRRRQQFAGNAAQQ